MTPIRGPLARLDRSREELAKAWLVRLIERASLEEISDLPTDRIARELPELISDMVRAAASEASQPYELSDEQTQRAAGLAGLRGGRDASAGELARDIASLQAVLVRALHEELADSHPDRFAEAVERLVDAGGAIQAAAVEELVRARSRTLETQANTDALTGLHNLRYLQRQLRVAARVLQALQAPVQRPADGRRRAQARQRRARPSRRRSPADAGGDVTAALGPNRSTPPPVSAATSSACSRPSRTPRAARRSPSASRRRSPRRS